VPLGKFFLLAKQVERGEGLPIFTETPVLRGVEIDIVPTGAISLSYNGFLCPKRAKQKGAVPYTTVQQRKHETIRVVTPRWHPSKE
jgi:hypothetical protein